MATFGDFLRPAFPASRVQNVSDLHPKFALRPHHGGSMADIQSQKLRLGEEKRTRMWADAQRDGRPAEEEEIGRIQINTTNVGQCPIGRPAEYKWRPLFNVAKFGQPPLLEYRAVTLPRCETR